MIIHCQLKSFVYISVTALQTTSLIFWVFCMFERERSVLLAFNPSRILMCIAEAFLRHFSSFNNNSTSFSSFPSAHFSLSFKQKMYNDKVSINFLNNFFLFTIFASLSLFFEAKFREKKKKKKKSNLLSQELLDGFQLIGYFNQNFNIKNKHLLETECKEGREIESWSHMRQCKTNVLISISHENREVFNRKITLLFTFSNV